MKKTLIILLGGLLLAGCGNDNTITTTDVGNGTLPPTSTALTITAQNAPILGASMRDVLNGSGALDDEVSPGTNLNTIQAISWATVVQEVVNSQAFFSQGASRVIPGPTGGLAQVTQGGVNTTSVVFSDLMINNVTLRGEVTMTPTNVTFHEFQVSRLGLPPYQIDGGVAIEESRALNGAVVDDRDRYRYAFQVTEGAGTAQVDMLVTDDRDISATGVRSETEANGTVTFTNYRTLNGTVQVINTVPWVYNLPLPGGTVTLLAGGGIVQGNGALRRTVTAPNVIQTEVQVAGSPTFVPVTPLQ